MAARRQNSSCDQCRRSKRKCVFAPNADDTTNQICLTCTYLGRRCTFDFVTTRLAQKRRRLLEYSAATQDDQLNQQDKELSDVASIEVHNEDNVSCEASSANDSTSVQLAELYVSPDNNFGDFNQFGLIPDFTSWADLGLEFTTPNIDHAYVPGFWKGSPIKLHNSTMSASVLGGILDDAYKSMMNGIESRYLSYNSNLYSPEYKYRFELEVEDYEQQLNMDLIAQPVRAYSLDEHSTDLSNAEGQVVREITFVGLSRFLDHFGQFYGNPLSKQAKLDDQRALIATQRAFGLQWLSSSGSSGICNDLAAVHRGIGEFGAHRNQDSTNESSYVFKSAWHKARSLISAVKPYRSFTRIYTMFLFHSTNPPSGDEDYVKDAERVLDQGLHDFLHLRELVHRYCKILAPQSTYRLLLESSMKIFLWFGCVRDTLASMANDRDCVLPHPELQRDPSNSMRALNWAQSPHDETEMREGCQEATKYELRMFRYTLQLKELLQRNENLDQVNSLIEDALAVLDESQVLFGLFFETCISVFTKFSKKAQATSAFIVVFWVLGALTFGEQVAVAHNLGYLQTGCEALSKADQHRSIAINYMVKLTGFMAKLNDHGKGHVEISKGSNTRIPLISHHANFHPVITTIVLTIETIIERNTKAGSYLNPEDPAVEEWISSIKPLLTCLLDMDVTVAGSNTARQAFQKLAAAHSDILMDCWDMEDDPEYAIMI